LETNSEAVNVQNEEQIQDSAASTAQPGVERAPVGEDAAVEATEEEPTPKASAATDVPMDGEKAAESGEPEDPVAVLKEALAQAQAQAEEYLDGWQRARAEFANYRRREEQRREQSQTEIAGRVLGHFLPVLDDLERAFSSVPLEVQDSPWMEGLSLVAQKMLSGMEKEGVAPIPVEQGDPFDPSVHMAVLHLPCDGYDEGQIAMVLQRGYTIGKRVLRPAMVQVSSGRTCEDADGAAEEPASSSAEETND